MWVEFKPRKWSSTSCSTTLVTINQWYHSGSNSFRIQANFHWTMWQLLCPAWMFYSTFARTKYSSRPRSYLQKRRVDFKTGSLIVWVAFVSIFWIKEGLLHSLRSHVNLMLQLSIYPIFPTSLDVCHEINLDITHSSELEIWNDELQGPELLILPSRLKSFSKVRDLYLIWNLAEIEYHRMWITQILSIPHFFLREHLLKLFILTSRKKS